MRPRLLSLLALLSALAFAMPAAAADLIVNLRTADGRPVQDAVVTIHAPGGRGPAPMRFSWAMSVAQHNIAFEPFVLIVPVGSDVTFPNRDQVRHHVYSFSAVKKFELKLYGREENRIVHFDKSGIVPLGCNIHDQMVGFIDVVDTPFAAKSTVAGVAEVRGAPAGTVTVTIWHPYLRAPGNQITRTVVLPTGGLRQTFTLELRAPAPMHHG